jgi:hypothetical protein
MGELGSGLTNEAANAPYIVVDLLTVVGESLYVAGAFSEAGGISAANIARWDGGTWHALGSGVDSQVLALATDGVNLYVSGHFTTAGGISANQLAQWDGDSWHVLGSATAIGRFDRVNALAAGGGNVYISGEFHSVGGVAANNIARWDGAAWRSLGSGIASEESEIPFIFPVLGLSASELFIGGTFISAGGRPSVGFARWSIRPLRHVFLPSVSS